MINVCTDRSKLDIDFIYSYLSTSYWASERTREQVIKSIDHSLCFGLYLDDIQIGFARVLTDQVVFSYIMDVFIGDQYQSDGYGKVFLDQIYKHSYLVNVGSHYLLTKDAQSFYHKLGFEEYPTPNRFMKMNGKSKLKE